jgi:hypothetical protein
LLNKTKYFKGIHAGGKYDCSSYIASYGRLNSQIQTLFSNMIEVVSVMEQNFAFQIFVNALLTNGSDDVSAADLEALSEISAGEEAAANCIIPYIVIQ